MVSLKTASDRRASFERRAQETNLVWEFFDAHTSLSEDLYYNDRDAIIARGLPLDRAELGCYSSHFCLWSKLVEDEDYERYLVFEDDIIIDWKFMEELVRLSEQEIGCDLLHLYFLRLPMTRQVRRGFIGRTRKIVELFGNGFGTQAYLINKQAARRLVDHLRHVVRPVDNAMECSWLHGIPNMSVFPFPVLEETGPTHIGDRSIKVSIPTALRLRGKLFWAVERIKRAKWEFSRRWFARPLRKIS